MDKRTAGLRELLAANLKEQRRVSGLSQAKLARKVNTSTHNIAMIELCRSFPSPEMLERIAAALGVEAQELFSMPPSETGALKRLRLEVTAELEQAVNTAAAAAVTGAVTTAIEEAVERIIARRLRELEAAVGEGR